MFFKLRTSVWGHESFILITIKVNEKTALQVSIRALFVFTHCLRQDQNKMNCKNNILPIMRVHVTSSSCAKRESLEQVRRVSQDCL